MTAHRRDAAFRTWTRSAATALGLVSLVVAAPAAAFADASPPADETTTPTPTETAPAEDTTDAEETEAPEATDTEAPAEETESPAPAETTPPPTDPASVWLSFDLAGYVDDASPDSPSGSTADGASSAGEGPHEVDPNTTVPISLSVTNTGPEAFGRISVRDSSGAVVADQYYGEPGTVVQGDTVTIVVDAPTPSNGETVTQSYTVFTAGIDDAVSNTFTTTLVGTVPATEPGITATSYANDQQPNSPIGLTLDGQDSTGPITVPGPQDVPISIVTQNSGSAPIHRLTIATADGEVIVDDGFDIDGVSQFPPGASWVYTTTLPAGAVEDGYDNTYTVTAYTATGEATATTGIRIVVGGEGIATSFDLYANDANPSSPTGWTAGGADSSTESAPLAVPAGKDVTLSFVVTNIGTVPIQHITIGGMASEDVLIDVTLDELLQPGETYVGTATLTHRMFDGAFERGEVFQRDYSVAVASGENGGRDLVSAYAYDHLQLVQAAGTANGAADDGSSLAATGTDSAGLLMGTTAVALLIGAAGITLLARRRQSSDQDG